MYNLGCTVNTLNCVIFGYPTVYLVVHYILSDTLVACPLYLTPSLPPSLPLLSPRHHIGVWATTTQALKGGSGPAQSTPALPPAPLTCPTHLLYVRVRRGGVGPLRRQTARLPQVQGSGQVRTQPGDREDALEVHQRVRARVRVVYCRVTGRPQ